METRYGKHLNKILPNMRVHLCKVKNLNKRTKSFVLKTYTKKNLVICLCPIYAVQH